MAYYKCCDTSSSCHWAWLYQKKERDKNNGLVMAEVEVMGERWNGRVSFR